MSEKATVDHCTKLEATFSVPGQISMAKFLVWHSRQFSLLWFAVALKYNTRP